MPARLFRFLAFIIPAPSTLIVLCFWVLLTLFTIHAVGAFLSAIIDAPTQVLTATFAITILLPILIAPKPTWEPMGWGIALDVLILVVVGMLPLQSTKMLERHGDWELPWLRKYGVPPRAFELVERVDDYSLWALSQVPVKKLDEMFGSAGIPYWKVRGTLPDDSSEEESGAAVEPDNRRGPIGQGVAQSGPKEIPTSPDDPYWARQAASPSTEKVLRQEGRLWQILNFERSREGVSSLLRRDDLSRVARAHSTAMARDHFFDHKDPQGRGPNERAKEAHLNVDNLVEVIGRVEDSADISRDLANSFLAKSRDRNVIFNRAGEYEAGGVGIACVETTCYGTILFLE